MHSVFRIGVAVLAIAAIACGRMEQSSRSRPGDGAVIFQSTILTMDESRPTAEAVIIKDGDVLDLGAIDDLVQAYPGATFDERFLRRTLLPALVDVRLPSNALNVTEIPCQGGVTPEEIAALASGGEPVRIVAGGPAALAAVIEALRRLPEGAGSQRVAIEARGYVSAEAARMLTALGVPLVLSAEPPAAGCAASSDRRSEDAAPLLSGLIAIAATSEDASLLGAAAGYLQEGRAARLSPQEALEAITRDAATAIGDETTRGVIKRGRRAQFAILDRNPLATPADAWSGIVVETADLAAKPTE